MGQRINYYRVKQREYATLAGRPARSFEIMMTMSDAQIDEAIVSFARRRWKKVARVIAEVAEAMGQGLPPGEEGLEMVAQRIESLVHDRHLLAQGDISNSRFSEVRLPD